MPPQTPGESPGQTNLSARWTYPERVAIKVDTLGRVDISGWAKATSGPVRPEVKTERHASQTITSIRKVEELGRSLKPITKHEPSKVVLIGLSQEPAKPKKNPATDTLDIIAFSNKLNAFFATRVKRKRQSKAKG